MLTHKKICAFFGHRTVTDDISAQLDAAIRIMIEKYGVSVFWAGGYGQFDAQAANAVHRLKAAYPQIELLLIRAYLPKPGEKLAECYDGSLYPDGLEAVPYRFAISRRNEYMAKRCDTSIGYINYTFGGAYRFFRLAVRRGKPCVNLGRYAEEPQSNRED